MGSQEHSSEPQLTRRQQAAKLAGRADFLAAMGVYRKAQAALNHASLHTPERKQAQIGFRQTAEVLRAMGALDHASFLIVPLTDADRAELASVYRNEKARSEAQAPAPAVLPLAA